MSGAGCPPWPRVQRQLKQVISGEPGVSRKQAGPQQLDCRYGADILL